MNEIDFYHGCVLYRMICGKKSTLIERYLKSSSIYVLNERTGIYIKYSKKRMSPWYFSFLAAHRDNIIRVSTKFEKFYIVFVCNDDGICCLRLHELSSIISLKSRNYPKTVRVSRKKREKYTVSGSDNRLNYKIGNSDFPKKLYE